MKDREAIRRLAELLEHHFNRLGDVSGVSEVAALFRDMDREPAAPTVTQIEEAFDRGYEQARRDITADSLKAHRHPTVTREQADVIRRLAERQGYDGSPAFFHAVADKLEEK